MHSGFGNRLYKNNIESYFYCKITLVFLILHSRILNPVHNNDVRENNTH